MFGSENVDQSISGSNNRGLTLPLKLLYFKSLPTTNRIGRAQCAHSVLISIDNRLFSKRPSTKGAAIASSAQAA
jgi:hypothetical protein